MSLAVPDTQNPVSILLTLGSVALMLPAALLGRLCLSTWRGLVAYPAAVKLAAERASHERSA